MPDLWIDEHLGDEAVARPDFRTDLRAILATELDGHRTPWRRIAWAVAAAAAVIAAVYVVTKDDDRTLQPVTSEATTTTEFLQGDDLAQRISDQKWYVVSIDGRPVTNRSHFTLHSDRTLNAFDGCNTFAFDESIADGWSLNGRLLHLAGPLVSTAIACEGVESTMPLVDNCALSLDGNTLTITNDHVYVASTDPADQLDLDIPAAG